MRVRSAWVGMLLVMIGGLPPAVDGSTPSRGWVNAKDGARLVAAREAAARGAAARGLGTDVSPLAQYPGPGALGSDVWIGDGIPVTSSTAVQFVPTVAPDNFGGVITSFIDFRRGHYDIYAMRIDGFGHRLWSAGGVALSLTDSTMILPLTLPDGSGGAFVVFGQYSGGAGYSNIIATHVTSGGIIAAGWPANGLGIAPGGATAYNGVATNDGFLLMGWQDPAGQLRMVRLTGAGAYAPGWSASGVLVGHPENEGTIAAAPDGAGGSYLCWAQSDSVMLTRVASGGTIPSGWSAAGTVVTSVYSVPFGLSAAPLTSGDVMVFWPDLRSFVDLDLYAQRYTPAGAVAGGWPADGVLAVGGEGHQTRSDAVSDGAGGAVVLCEVGSDSALVQRVTAAGATSAGWPANGVTMCRNTAKSVSALISDGAGGALLAWSAVETVDEDIFAGRIAGTGATAAGWAGGGKVVSDATGGQFDPVIVSDNAGGLIAVWQDSRDQVSQPIYAARVLADGTVAARIALVSASAAPGLARLHWFDPEGAVFEAAVERAAGPGGFTEIARVRFEAGHARFDDRDVVAGETYRYRLVLTVDGATRTVGEVTLRVPDGALLTLSGFLPNPAVGALRLGYALPTAERARIEVIDVAGRRVLGRDLDSTPGEHVVSFDGAALRPGVYVLRLMQGSRAVTAWAVVAR